MLFFLNYNSICYQNYEKSNPGRFREPDRVSWS